MSLCSSVMYTFLVCLGLGSESGPEGSDKVISNIGIRTILQRMGPGVVFYNTFTVYGHWQQVTFTKKQNYAETPPPKTPGHSTYVNNFYSMRHGNSHTGVRCHAPAFVEIKLSSSAHRRVLALQPLLHNDEKVFVTKGSKQKHENKKNRGEKN
jgi:hypothetical protein